MLPNLDDINYHIECILQDLHRPDLIENLNKKQTFIITREILTLCYFFKTGDFNYTDYRYSRMGRLLNEYRKEA